MTTAEYEKIRAAIDGKKRVRLQKVEADYAEEIQALERVRLMAQEVAERDTTQADATKGSTPRSKLSATPLIRRAIYAASSPFTNRSIREYVLDNFERNLTPNEIASVFNKLVKKRQPEMRKVREARDNDAAEYVAIHYDAFGRLRGLRGEGLEERQRAGARKRLSANSSADALLDVKTTHELPRKIGF